MSTPWEVMREISLVEHEERQRCAACGKRRLCVERPTWTGGLAWLCRQCREWHTATSGFAAFLLSRYAGDPDPDAGPPASTDAVSPDERARGTSQAADTTAEAARALGLTPRPLP